VALQHFYTAEPHGAEIPLRLCCVSEQAMVNSLVTICLTLAHKCVTFSCLHN